MGSPLPRCLSALVLEPIFVWPRTHQLHEVSGAKFRCPSTSVDPHIRECDQTPTPIEGAPSCMRQHHHARLAIAAGSPLAPCTRTLASHLIESSDDPSGTAAARARS